MFLRTETDLESARRIDHVIELFYFHRMFGITCVCSTFTVVLAFVAQIKRVNVRRAYLSPSFIS